MRDDTLAAVLLCSGGLDSTTLAFWLCDKGVDFLPLFIDYGQHCVETEYETLCRVLPQETVPLIERVDISSLYHSSRSRLIREADLWTESVNDDDLYLPYRNLLILSVGAAFAQSRSIAKVYSAFINSNRAKEIDCSAAFFAQMGELLSNYGPIEIMMPFRNMSKLEVARMGIGLKAPIAQKFSCQASSEVPCGACPNCVERLDALAQLG